MKVTAPSAVHAGAYDGVEIDGRLDLPHRRPGLVQARLGVAEQDVRGSVIRIGLQRELGARTRRLELAAEQQDGAGAHLRVDVGGIEISGARVLGVGVHQIAAVLIRAAQLVTHRGVVRHRRQRPPVFDHRFLELLFRGVCVAARGVLACLGLGTRARDGAGRRDGQRQRGSQPHDGSADSHGSRVERYGNRADENVVNAANASAGLEETGVISRTRPPSVRRSRAASSISHALFASSLATTRERP